ncbi:MAG TPA: Gfo/Idh/MocA family oxidoreductase [Terriglobia bacterium]|nr:Gfo/Idh/MocA family oxidoreductase [Terriglobia bacterium]
MSRSRRNFLGILGGAAALPLAERIASGAVFQPNRGRVLGNDLTPQEPGGGGKIGYAIVGLGRISMGQFMPGVKAAGRRSQITALVSGHPDKAARVAAQYGVPRRAIYNYQNYEQIAHNSNIDAVYIALPNGMHAEYTIRAAQSGKHVLCEKPMANSIAECEQMIDACRKANRKLMVAYRCRLEPTNLRAVQLIRDGYVGKLQIIDTGFGFNIAPGEWRLNKKMAGGGPMVDVGIYSLQACRYLSGEEPVEVSANWSVIDRDGRFTEVEENLNWTMRFPSGVLATCYTSYGANCGNTYRATGSKGWVELGPAFTYEGIRMHSEGAESVAIAQPATDRYPDQFSREADHFAECILGDHEPVTPGEEGLRDEKLIQAIYQSCRENRPMKA